MDDYDNDDFEIDDIEFGSDMEQDDEGDTYYNEEDEKIEDENEEIDNELEKIDNENIQNIENKFLEEKNKKKKNVLTDYDRTLSNFELTCILSSRARAIDSGRKSFCHEEVIKNEITSSINIAEYEFKKGKLKYKYQRKYPDGTVKTISYKDVIFFPELID